MFALLAAFLLAIPAITLINTPDPFQPLPKDITISESESVVIAGGINIPLPFMINGEQVLINDTNVILQQVMMAARKTPERVTIVLDSPGGRYTPGAEIFLKYLDYLVEQGTAVRCVIAGKAMSLAAIIFSHCSERYATPNSVFMFHAARAFLLDMANQFELMAVADKLKEMDNKIWTPLRALINDIEYFDTNFKSETVISVLDLVKQFPKLLQITGKITITP